MIPNSQTLSIAINAEPAAVYAFASDPRNLTKWATAFCKSVTPAADDTWRVETPQGVVHFRFVDFNDFGVLDHYVRISDDVEIYVPMRVVDSGDGSTVLFTLFRMPDMSDAKFNEDLQMVERDLQTLKRVLEAVV
jgi:hypothetical protein